MANSIKLPSTKLQTVVFVIIFVAIIFTMSIIRGQCINIGYDLSQLASEVEQRRIKIETVEAAQAKLINKETLFNTATRHGFVLMNEGRTFNVQ